MNQPLTIQCDIRVERRHHGRQQLREGVSKPAVLPTGRVPRVVRLMALAIKLDGLARNGTVGDYAELARLGHVSRARITQIMNLLLLAPDIQEKLLFLPLVERGREAIHLRDLQPIAAVADWKKQRKHWKDLWPAMALHLNSRLLRRREYRDDS